MRIAAFSDVHGDVSALARVLASIKADRVELTVNLGDSFSGDLFPHAVADLLMAMPIVSVRGNHERTMCDDRIELSRSDRHAVDNLNADQLRFISNFSAFARPERDILLVHGIPGDDTIGFLETATPQGLRAATDEEIRARVGDESAALILCGHTHVPRWHFLGKRQLILCPGSVHRPLVGQNMLLGRSCSEGMTSYAVVAKNNNRWQGEVVLIEADNTLHRIATA